MNTYFHLDSPQTSLNDPLKNVKRDISISNRSSYDSRVVVADKLLQCKFCHKQYGHKSSLSRHIATTHSDKAGLITCDLCTTR